MAFTKPSPSEAQLANINDTGRLAYILDALLTLSGSGGFGYSTRQSFSYISAAAANQDAVQVSAVPANLLGFDAGNTAAYWTYVKFYNKAAPTSADTPVRMFALPPGGGISKSDMNLPFSTAMGIRITKLPAANDATAVIAGDVVIGGIDFQN